MSKITVTTIAGQTSGADANKVKIDPSNTLHVPGHASIGVDAVASTRGLTVAGATDGSGSSALVVYNSSLASKFSVRDDGLTTITNNATVGGTLGVTGTATLSGNATIGTNSGDTRFSLNSANQYTMVLKNAGNIAGQIGGGGTDDLRFSNAAGATTMQIKDGRVLKPLQPAFSATADTTNIPLQTSTTVALSGERFDVGGNLDANTFTAPISGKYLFCFMFYFSSVDADHTTLDAHIKTSNKQYQVTFSPDHFLNSDSNFSITGSMICDMDANDTCYFTTYVQGGAAQTDIHSDSQVSGALIC